MGAGGVGFSAQTMLQWMQNTDGRKKLPWLNWNPNKRTWPGGPCWSACSVPPRGWVGRYGLLQGVSTYRNISIVFSALLLLQHCIYSKRLFPLRATQCVASLINPLVLLPRIQNQPLSGTHSRLALVLSPLMDINIAEVTHHRIQCTV
jgi:hypothetical protein